MTIRAREATTEDCVLLGPRLRPADREEVLAASGFSGTEALALGMRASERCWTAVIETDEEWEPFGMFGVVPDLSSFTGLDQKPRVGYIWWLGTDRIEEAPKSFTRLAREWIEQLGSRYDILTNVVDARNTRHHKWLHMMGFKFTESIPDYGHEGRPFLRFVRAT